MVRMTVISRIPDGLLLCASMESENDTAEMTQYKNKAKDMYVAWHTSESVSRLRLS